MSENKIIDRMYDYLQYKANSYGLTVRRINDFKISVFAPRYNLDDWIIEFDMQKKEVILWHHSKKKNRSGKCFYHIQKKYSFKNKKQALVTILKHNKFKAFYKYEVNMVDYLLSNKNSRIKFC